jgi:hypothetical protein
LLGLRCIGNQIYVSIEWIESVDKEVRRFIFATRQHRAVSDWTVKDEISRSFKNNTKNDLKPTEIPKSIKIFDNNKFKLANTKFIENKKYLPKNLFY